MRVLCLHDEGSRGEDLDRSATRMKERLRKKHGIELVFVEAPFVSNVSNDDGRTWWFQKGDGASSFVGLDASMLHVRQIWTKCLYSNPFCGILGVGQGAALASLLSLLHAEQHDDDESSPPMMMMLPGLCFAVFIRGYDILSTNHHQNDEQTLEKVDTDGEGGAPLDPDSVLHTLHILATAHDHRSMALWKRHGGNQQQHDDAYTFAHIHTLQSSCGSSPRGNDTNGIDFADWKQEDWNVLGKYLVHRKNAIMRQNHKQTTAHCLLQQHQQQQEIPSVVETSRTVQQIALQVQETRTQLALVEKMAFQFLQSSIARHPPKALMAVIDSNSGFMGGWIGNKHDFRSGAFIRAGGAPCPKEFLLPKEARPSSTQQPQPL